MHYRIFRTLQALVSHTYFPVGILILVNLVFGVWTVTDFGESWDERPRLQYARASLDAYAGADRGLEDEKGSAYVIIAELGSDMLSKIIPKWSTIDAWHFMNFLSFQIAVFFLFVLCLRFTHKWGAFGATLLFSTQPLLWGHSFINPKDIPFMAAFLATIALGVQMADTMASDNLVGVDHQAPDEENRVTFATQLSQDWHRARGRGQITLCLISALSLGLLLLILSADTLIRQRLIDLIYRAYNAETSTLLTAIFSRLAENMQALPLENYVSKALSLYSRFRTLYTLAAVLGNLLVLWYWFQSARHWLWSHAVEPYARLMTRYLANKHVLLAAILLGLCSSIRTLGPAAGLLIAAYWLAKMGQRALPALVVYLSIATAVTYIAWPGLWGAPLSNFLRSLSDSADFGWDGQVLFQGLEIDSDQLPRTYLPVLLSLQFTLTALLMFAIGFFVSFRKIYRRRIDIPLVLLIAAWLLVPILAVVIRQPTMYDNFRHFLFIIPPIFIFASPAIGMLIEKLNNLFLSVALLLVLILPGVYWDIALHPYQYVYYNAFAGWTSGAFRQYEMDYWATSYREAALYLNTVAPPNGQVLVWGPEHLVRRYARLDLNIVEFEDGMHESETIADYAVISTRHNNDRLLFPESPSTYQVSRHGAIFAVVKNLQ
jgi:hypothetical protein